MPKSESLVIGKNPHREEVASGFDPKQLGANAVERLLKTLVATQERKQVIAFGQEKIIYLTKKWFDEIETLPPPDQKELVRTGVVNIMSSDRAIVVKKTPPIT